MDRPLKDKTALITGSSRGIGKAIAIALSRLGCDVVINYTKQGGSSEQQAGELSAAIESMGCKSLIVKTDISSREAVKEMFSKITSHFGRLDFLILNAARAPFKPIEKLFDREMRMLVEVNLFGNVYCVQQSLPLLEKSQGRIVFISSLGSRFYNPSYPLGLMKSAMEALIRDLSCSLSDRGIHANALCGGIVKTDSFKVLRQVWEGIDRIPDNLILEPEEIADVVTFLCLPQSRGIRGQTIVVDRGLSNRLYHF